MYFIYGDGTVFYGQWLDTPQHRDVQVILFEGDDGWTLRHGAAGRSQCDFYRQAADGSVVGMDLSGFIDHVVYELKLVEPCTDLPTMIHAAVHELGIVKQGKMLTTRRWQEIYRQALLLRAELMESDGST